MSLKLSSRSVVVVYGSSDDRMSSGGDYLALMEGIVSFSVYFCMI